MHIGIIGAGHAGVEAARAAREAGADVTLFSAEAAVPYFRPRLVALAFGQADFAAIQIHPAEWYAAQGIDLRLNAPIQSVDPAACRVTTAGGTLSFDGLVFAAGANPLMPRFTSDAGPCVQPLWSLGHAEDIRKRARQGERLVVVGGGILGIEAALRALEVGMSVEIVELMDRLMPSQFGLRASVVLQRRLTERGVTVTLGQAVAKALPQGDRSVVLQLDGGEARTANLCLVSIGARPNAGLAAAAGLSVQRGVRVDGRLRTSAARVFAAGDAIQFEGLTRCSVKEAIAQGRIAGGNVVAAVAGNELREYRPETLPLMFRAQGFELYSIGDPGGDGCEEHLLEGTTESTIRALIKKDGLPIGVQMIGTRDEFDEYSSLVKQSRKG